MLDLLPEALRDFAVGQAGHLLIADRPGPRMKQLRARFGMTQQELADLLDLRRETLSRVESGSQSPSADLLRDLVRVFTMAHAAREHAAAREADDRPLDQAHLTRVAKALGLKPTVADGVVMKALASYGGKRKAVLEDLKEGQP